MFVYANQRYYEDTTNSVYQNLADQAGSLEVVLKSATAFVTPEILAIPEERIKQFMQAEGKLTKYKRVLEVIYRNKPHTLTAEQEEILANAGELITTPSTIFEMFNSADVKFADIIGEDGQPAAVTHGRFISYMESNNRDVRKAAFESVYSAYGSMKNTLAATYAANVKASMFYAKAKKFNNTLEMYLNDSNIPVNVYTNLIQSVHDNLPKFYKYVSLRKKLLGVDELHMYDVYAPLVSEVTMKYSFDEAKQMWEQVVMLGKNNPSPQNNDLVDLAKENIAEAKYRIEHPEVNDEL